MSIRHPVVAISYAHDSPAAPEWFSRELDRLATPVVDALRARGVQVRVLDAVRDTEPEAAASGADAVIVLGGADIDPTLYRHTPHSTVQGTHRPADEFETRLIRAAVNLDRPVLGICRGAQLVNVALGGTLVQHLGDDAAHRSNDEHDGFTRHEIEIEPETRLSAIVGNRRLEVTSAHHQAVDLLGEGLRIAARADDGVVEAIESHAGAPWILGVQWHPEAPRSTPEDLAVLLDALVARAAASQVPTEQCPAFRAMGVL
ncbi:gamma-glutamyl-gamma-aminobutyrate hydrolase family protein [Microbacterium sp.]|uniref:gamma-glutamyl-gamma-aminobutyrate hydrolase family protein n=1 Tax=Microbacterium sp. TaxID=51671 RepID=UPI003C77DDCA